MNRETVQDIIGRVEAVRKQLGHNKSRFSAEIGMKPQTYNNFIGAQGSKPNADLLLGCVTRFGVNAHWLLVGQEPMFVPGGSMPRATPVAPPTYRVVPSGWLYEAPNGSLCFVPHPPAGATSILSDMLDAFPGFKANRDDPVEGGDLVEWINAWLSNHADI